MDILPSGSTERSFAGSEQAGLLERRMASVGLAVEAVAGGEPDIFWDLQVLCATCEYCELCEGDLRDAVPGWEDYCPNAVVLKALSEVGRLRAGN